MTVSAFLRSLARRWYVAVVGAALTALALQLVHTSAGAYWARVTLVVLLPTDQSTAENSLLSKSPIAIASLAVMEVNRSAPTLHSASPDANLVGMGERSATLIQVRNTGVQWVPSASLPYIDIEAVGRSEAEVQERIEKGTQEIHDALARLQDEMDVPPSMRVFAEEDNDQLVVDHIPTSPRRAAAGIVLAGGGVTMAAIIIVDRLLTRRRPRRSRSHRNAPAAT